MNKRQLIEAIQGYPDDAPIVVARDAIVGRGIETGYYTEDHRGGAIYSISSDPEVIRLEL